jgi:prepilin-type N-terminal cleavage/methylation domain-containing protein
MPARARNQGFSLLEITAVVSALAVILAVAIPTLARSVRASKVSEATEQLDALYRASAAYYAVPRGEQGHCLPEAAGPTPELPSTAPVAVDFAAASSGAETWKALGFAPKLSLRYRYSFLPSVSGCGLPRGAPPHRLVLRAEGDLDGDGVLSTFERHAAIESDGKLSAEPVLHVQDRIE